LKTTSEALRRQQRAPELPLQSCKDLENKVFEATVVISSREVALSEAEKETGLRAEPGRIVYWTDASSIRKIGGIGICYFQSSNTWEPSFWRVVQMYQPDILETYAIAEALELALDHYQKQDVKETPTRVDIYSDCVSDL
jgi:hypothetical protein